jgi:hypothetical protein
MGFLPIRDTGLTRCKRELPANLLFARFVTRETPREVEAQRCPCRPIPQESHRPRRSGANQVRLTRRKPTIAETLWTNLFLILRFGRPFARGFQLQARNVAFLLKIRAISLFCEE